MAIQRLGIYLLPALLHTHNNNNNNNNDGVTNISTCVTTNHLFQCLPFQVHNFFFLTSDKTTHWEERVEFHFILLLLHRYSPTPKPCANTARSPTCKALKHTHTYTLSLGTYHYTDRNCISLFYFIMAPSFHPTLTQIPLHHTQLVSHNRTW